MATNKPSLQTHMVAWNREGKVALVWWPSQQNWFDYDHGASLTFVQKLSRAKRCSLAKDLALSLIVDYGVDPKAVLAVMSELDEWTDEWGMF